MRSPCRNTDKPNSPYCLAFRCCLFHYSKSRLYLCYHDSHLQDKHFLGFLCWTWIQQVVCFSLSKRSHQIYSERDLMRLIFLVCVVNIQQGDGEMMQCAVKTLDMQLWTKSPVTILFPWGWNSEVFGNQLMFSIYCPLYVPCNSPAPWAQLDRQTPKGAVSLGMAN